MIRYYLSLPLYDADHVGALLALFGGGVPPPQKKVRRIKAKKKIFDSFLPFLSKTRLLGKSAILDDFGRFWAFWEKGDFGPFSGVPRGGVLGGQKGSFLGYFRDKVKNTENL